MKIFFSLFFLLFSCLAHSESLKVIEEKRNFSSPDYIGNFSFDYSKNNGEYVIGSGDYTFRTRWSKKSDTAICAYKDGKGMEACSLFHTNKKLKDIKKMICDFSSRCVTIRLGECVVWKNSNGHFAITKVVEIKDNTRNGAKKDKVKCQYFIFRKPVAIQQRFTKK